ncbi:hypothetical protein [Mycobacterium uberis]|uniref:hypothetical protein n=1 Tax=Mycobacterium uberis TaxID=2162698 RepID=UPI001402FEE8|nr:hypothetical protein [Mycobacterium uberis]
MPIASCGLARIVIPSQELPIDAVDVWACEPTQNAHHVVVVTQQAPSGIGFTVR